jgi:hypothetical protein
MISSKTAALSTEEETLGRSEVKVLGKSYSLTNP